MGMENECRPGVSSVIAAALKAGGIEWTDSGVMKGPGVRVEAKCGRVKVATISLSRKTRYGESLGERWVQFHGTLPGQITTAMEGWRIERVLRHPFTDGAGLVVDSVEDLDGRTRVRFRQPSADIHLSLADIEAS